MRCVHKCVPGVCISEVCVLQPIIAWGVSFNRIVSQSLNLNPIGLFLTERGKRDVETQIIDWVWRLEKWHSKCQRLYIIGCWKKECEWCMSGICIRKYIRVVYTYTYIHTNMHQVCRNVYQVCTKKCVLVVYKCVLGVCILPATGCWKMWVMLVYMMFSNMHMA